MYTHKPTLIIYGYSGYIGVAYIIDTVVVLYVSVSAVCMYKHNYTVHKPTFIPFFYAASRQCDGEASICDAVSSWDLILNCSLCSSAKEVQWKRDTVPLPYHTAVAKIPAKDVEPSDSGCYTCVCYGKSHSFSVAIQAAGK